MIDITCGACKRPINYLRDVRCSICQENSRSKGYDSGFNDRASEIDAIRDHLLETYGGFVEEVKQALKMAESCSNVFTQSQIFVTLLRSLNESIKEYGV